MLEINSGAEYNDWRDWVLLCSAHMMQMQLAAALLLFGQDEPCKIQQSPERSRYGRALLGGFSLTPACGLVYELDPSALMQTRNQTRSRYLVKR